MTTRSTLRSSMPVFGALVSFLVVFSMAQPLTASEVTTLDSTKCSETPLDVAWKQVPSCKTFTPMTGAAALDPLSYLENTDNSLIALEGATPPSDTVFEVLTPSQCSNPRFLSPTNLVDKGVSYVLFKSEARGMCRIKVSSAMKNVTTIIEVPIMTWRLINEFSAKPSVQGGKNPNLSTLTVGKSLQLTNLRFFYPSPSYDFSSVGPVEIVVETPNQCSVTAQAKVTALASGDCEISLGWPTFAIGSRIFPRTQKRMALFTAQTAAEAQLAETTRKQNEKALAEKRKADAKLCSPSKQSKLRSRYRLISESNERMAELSKKANRVRALISMNGKDMTIQLPPSEFKEIFSSWPVLGSTRQVPLWAYSAALAGAIEGESKNYANARKLAEFSYSRASKGCQQVVGKP